MAKNSRHLHISGLVQGVFYRAEAQRKALQLGLTGWIRNNADGSVEALAVGEANAIAEFIDWCRVGPSKARVERVDVSDASVEIFTTFSIVSK